MKILFDIVHPADVLFFKRPLDILTARDDEILILSRHKDVACELLDEFGYSHSPITTAGRGPLGLAAELVRRDISLILAARRFKPDVMIGFGGVAISHAGKVLGIPTISFYDSENAKLQTSLSWPFIDYLYVPESYSGRTPRCRTVRIPGTKELSYFHPKAFSPDRDVAIRNGLAPDKDNFLLRVVDWRANHDLRKSGWTDETLRAVITRLEKVGRVHLSSEVPVAPEFERLLYRGSISQMHHMIAHCRLYIGESATMASEAAIMGVPAIYCGRDFPGYIRELEAANLVRTPPADEMRSIFAVVENYLSEPLAHVRTWRDHYLRTRPDWAFKVIEAIDRAVAKRPS